MRIIERADAIAATCTDEAFELIRLGADPARLSVVPCGVDVDAFRPDGAAEPRTPGRARLVCLGRLVERKGLGDVISALPLLQNAELIVVGGPEAAALASDPEARRLLDLARELGVAERVRLRGRVGRDAVPALLRSADAVVCAPWYEPFGIVPLEAMACGVPVVATAVGGMVDSVVHEVTGLHVPPRNPPALAAALATLLDDAPLRDELGAAGVERVRARYTWAHVAAATLEVYAGVLAPVHATAEAAT
jgi:glycosyltransferase involved in cell wall biosynthesis